MNNWLKCAVAAGIVVATAGAASAQDSLPAARELYAAAAYEDALLLLNRLRVGEQRIDEQRAIEQYRAFCLLALGRANDAERAIEAVVAAAPSYQPSEADVSPRVRTAFSDVRRRMLPGIAQQKYATGKAAFDRKDFAAATQAFDQLLGVLADPDLGAAASQPPLSDIRTLATGFRELSVTAAAPPPPPVPSPPPPPRAPAAPRIYTTSDQNVVPPVVIRQALPSFPAQVLVEESGAIEVIIDETGAVEAATMRKAIHPRYDSLAVAGARLWQYRPATLNGVPVKYRRIVQISLKR